EIVAHPADGGIRIEAGENGVLNQMFGQIDTAPLQCIFYIINLLFTTAQLPCGRRTDLSCFFSRIASFCFGIFR
ncbi:MAG: hypothetical protein IKS29_05870, partial [Oscillospiraceae bacterium]|nr:hypothetical protein [Oscillospiraceae bacterium]